MKVLMVGQLPAEVGGAYTNGVCNVIYELSKCSTSSIQYVVYATNMNDSKSKRVDYANYRGSVFLFMSYYVNLIFHPVIAFREWLFYKRKCSLSPIRYLAYQYNIERIIREERPNMIHCMNVYQMPSCYMANKKFNLPLILTLHGVDTTVNSQDYIGVCLADVVTGLTPDTIRGIKKMGISDDKIEMIPNGTDTSKFYYSDEERIKLRKELGIRDDTTMLLTIGALCHRKGQYSFLEKMNNLHDQFNYIYCIIGKGEDEDKIRSFIDQNSLQDKVKLIGYVKNTELYRYHSAADVYVHCSRSEGQALSEVEAYATDLKIALNTDVKGSVITDINNSEDYWVFDFGNFDYDSFVTWSTQHKHNRRTRKLYDWNKVFEMYSELYKNIKNK